MLAEKYFYAFKWIIVSILFKVGIRIVIFGNLFRYVIILLNNDFIYKIDII